jgi:hypothetical protein
VRTHQYDVLAHLGETEAERRVWRALAAARALDWRALGRVEVSEEELRAVRERHPEVLTLDLPCPPAGMGRKPLDEAGWRWYRRALQTSFLIRATGDPASALYLARPWVDCHVRELTCQDPVNREHALVRALDGPEADEALGRLLERWTDLALGATSPVGGGLLLLMAVARRRTRRHGDGARRDRRRRPSGPWSVT